MRPIFISALLLLCTAATQAQTKPGAPTKPRPAATRPAAAPSSPVGVRGFVTFGSITFQADDSFEAILDSAAGPIWGGGGSVLLPRGFYAEVSASRFRGDGERAFVGPAPDREVFKLGIPLQVSITPLQFTGGWRYRHCPRTAKPRAGGCRPRLIPYAGGGFSSYRYQEASDFAEAEEDIDERFSGYHIVGGVEYLPLRWMAVGGEVSWSSVADALGEGGVSAAFNEDNLGGTTVRLKISFGR